jgi:hypothetical protein
MIKKMLTQIKILKIACLTVVLMMAAACTEDKNTIPSSQIEGVHGSLNEMAYATLNYAASIPLLDINDQGTKAKIAIHTIEAKTNEFLHKNYFSGLPENFTVLLADEELKRSTLNGIVDKLSRNSNTRQSEILTGFIGSADVYSAEQMDYIEQFIAQVYQSDDMANFQAAIDSFNSAVEKSALTDDEKIMLYGFSASNQSLITFYTDGGIDAVSHDINQQLGLDPTSEGRVEDCEVNFRGVWAGAVVTGVVGGVKGGVIGATTGTFTVPVLGTAVGAVGGAVFGFTAGFVTGALGAVATGLLLTCGRNEVEEEPEPELEGKTQASCDQMQQWGLSLPMVCYEDMAWTII